MYRIFLVEDDETIAKLVRRHLEKWDYDVHVVQKFDAVMSEFASFDPHLVLMDIGLPFYNGYHWCTEIRRVSKVPVVFLSSAADNMNIVMAVSMGADDFIAKPFDLDVLTVKIQAIIRRCYDFGANNSVLEHNGAMLNISDATITYDDKRLELTKNELKILQTLFDNKERIVSRSLLMEKLWESDAYVDENTLSVNVNRLRHAILRQQPAYSNHLVQHRQSSKCEEQHRIHRSSDGRGTGARSQRDYRRPATGKLGKLLIQAHHELHNHRRTCPLVAATGHNSGWPPHSDAGERPFPVHGRNTPNASPFHGGRGEQRRGFPLKHGLCASIRRSNHARIHRRHTK